MSCVERVEGTKDFDAERAAASNKRGRVGTVVTVRVEGKLKG
jgi:hypothetical protein